MSEAVRPQPGADDEWDTIDEAVRSQYDEVLAKGADLLSGSDLMGRLDPLARRIDEQYIAELEGRR